jgi:glycosyltransferase involved in cell wall biosynthesis
MDNGFLYKISVGMPVWGVEKYIRRCLLSILNQDFDDMEVLVINDCTPDKSIEIVKEIASNHPKGEKIKIINQPQNMGCWAARNRILEEAKGKYILLIDSDDYFAENAIPNLYKQAEKTEAEITYGSIAVVDEEGKSIPNNGVQGIQQQNMVLRGKDQLASYANDNIHILKLHNFIWNSLIRTDFIRKHRLRFRKTKFWDDVLFNADMQPLVESAAFISNITYNYVIRDDSLSNYQSRDMIDMKEIRQHITNQEYLKAQSITLRGKPYFETRVTKMMLNMFYTIIGIIRNETKLSEEINKAEIRNAMQHPLKIKDIIQFKECKGINLLFWMIGIMPVSISFGTIRAIGKIKKLI